MIHFETKAWIKKPTTFHRVDFTILDVDQPATENRRVARFEGGNSYMYGKFATTQKYRLKYSDEGGLLWDI